jgi:RNA polymerase sigma-70 factor (ECF subfamily)
MKNWSHNGIPDSPKAWLRKVAQNQLTDHFRREKTYQEKVKPSLLKESPKEVSFEINDQIIDDSLLRMIFVVCTPILKTSSQFCLALRILCGFNIEEVAKALLSNKENINKKLYRAKKIIRDKALFDLELSSKDYVERLDNVLRVIYLLFNEGYYSSTNEENIREDICWEAMRLMVFLSNQDQFEKKEIYSLLALMCFHSSRLYARKFGENGDLLYHQQDKSKWDKDLIRKGQDYLKLSVQLDSTFSKYQIEASIAYWHTTDKPEKWNHILQYYNRLLQIEYSPIVALNRTYALAKANSVEEAISQALSFDLKENHHYYCLLAELYRINKDHTQEKEYLKLALKYAPKKSEQEMIKAKIEIAES